MLVAKELEKQHHTIVAMNWRTRWCEIDVVSKKGSVVYFTEVKFRQSPKYGSGFDYVHKTKQRQMEFAAEFWLAQNQWIGDALLLAAEVDGKGTITIVEL